MYRATTRWLNPVLMDRTRSDTPGSSSERVCVCVCAYGWVGRWVGESEIYKWGVGRESMSSEGVCLRT